MHGRRREPYFFSKGLIPVKRESFKKSCFMVYTFLIRVYAVFRLNKLTIIFYTNLGKYKSVFI